MNLKKTLLLSASLLLLGNVSGLSANASHVHHHAHHVRTVRMMSHHILTYRQLDKAMDYDYMNTSDKYTNIITRTIKHNLRHYSNHQIKSLLWDMDADPNNSPDFTSDELTNMQNVLYNRKSVLKKTSNQHSKFNNQLRSALIHDVNQSRIENGLKPLKVGGYTQKVADYREPHVQKAFDTYSYHYINQNAQSNPLDYYVHGMNNGTTDDEYMSENNYNFKNFGECATNWSQHFNGSQNGEPAKFYGTTLKYSNDTPSHLAYNLNDVMVNHDDVQGNHDTHRNIILNPSFHYIGVGVSYNPKTQIGGMNEQFLQ